jgi:hypothetical protein
MDEEAAEIQAEREYHKQAMEAENFQWEQK